LAPAIAARIGQAEGDLIVGCAGQGLFLLRLHQITGDVRWLTAAQTMADRMLARAVPSHGGLKFPSFTLPDGRTAFYPGLAHGSAGAAYFLCRVAQASSSDPRGRYTDAAVATSRWLDAIQRTHGDGLNWYRREPDQLNIEQVQWCHGAPGIGVFYTELYRLTRDPAHLESAKRCAALVESEGSKLGAACQCHGVGGNAGLFLKLFRETGDAAWLVKANQFADVVWSMRLPGTTYPGWRSGDSRRVDHPGLLTGTSGVGWLYLQLATGGKLGEPVTD
jgi:lantibiotic modifying enzyme